MLPRACAVTCTLVVLSAGGAAARGAPAAGAALSEDDKRFSVFAGLSLGVDTNPRRDSSGAEADTVTEMLAGVALTAGGERSRLDIEGEYRYDQYTALSELNYGEIRAGLRYACGDRRVS